MQQPQQQVQPQQAADTSSKGSDTSAADGVATDTGLLLAMDCQQTALLQDSAVEGSTAPEEAACVTDYPCVLKAMGLSAANMAGTRRVRRARRRRTVHTHASLSDDSTKASDTVTEPAVQTQPQQLKSHVSQLLNDRIDRSFTIDVREGQNSAVNAAECWSIDHFLQRDVSGQMLWIDMTTETTKPENTYTVLKHYVECKQKAPYTTGACVVVPAKPTSWPTPWTELHRPW